MMCHLIAVGSTSDQALKMGEGILLGAGWSPRRFDDPARDDIHMPEPGQRAMSDVLELASQHMSRLHRQVGMLARDGLHPGQLVHADGAFAALGPLRCLSIPFTSLDKLFVWALVGNRG